LKKLTPIVIEPEQIPREDQVAGTRDRQKFSKPLDHTQNQSLKIEIAIHAPHPLDDRL
jgi:hypothetical protein